MTNATKKKKLEKPESPVPSPSLQQRPGPVLPSRKNGRPDILSLELDVLVEHAAWEPKLRHLRKRMIAAIELTLLSQHKLNLKHPVMELSVILTDDRRIKRLNKLHRGLNKPTNVLSFPLGESPMEGAPFLLGDMILAFKTLETEAKAEKKPFGNHFVHLVVHSILHLCGYDHITPGRARTMERLEKTILAALDIPDPYAL